MAMLTLGLSCLVAEVLLLSAGYKASRPRDYWQAVNSYRMLRSVPRFLRLLLAWSAPPVETASAVLIVIPATRSYGLAAACAAFIIFYAVVGGDDRPVIAHCGCWSYTSLGLPRRTLLARNLVLIGAAAAALVMSQLESGASSIEDSQNIAILAAIGVALPFALLLQELPELWMIATLKPADGPDVGSAPPSEARPDSRGLGTMPRSTPQSRGSASRD